MLFLFKKSLSSSSEFSVSFLSAEVILPVHLTTTGLFGRLTKCALQPPGDSLSAALTRACSLQRPLWAGTSRCPAWPWPASVQHPALPSHCPFVGTFFMKKGYGSGKGVPLPNEGLFRPPQTSSRLFTNAHSWDSSWIELPEYSSCPGYWPRSSVRWGLKLS